jgi:hypothetical protein
MSYTIGGYPQEEAAEWNKETRQEFGACIYRLYSESPNIRLQGYLRYHELRRRFMLSDWDKEVSGIDQYRKEVGAKPIVDMIEEVRYEIVKHKVPLPSSQTDPGPVEAPTELKVCTTQESTQDNCEQLSLF